jgi:predicted AlkP superfamily pyrophosphatase or phosphodiesterase
VPHPLAVINVVGLSGLLIGASTPRLAQLARSCGARRLRPVLPAVTCSVQASMLTGRAPAEHGIVGNGWYDRQLAEVHFWKQSAHLVGGERVWEAARRRDPSVTCAQLFWWFNMHSSADWSVTPRPMYTADGRKLPDVYATPEDLRPWLQERLGVFPLFKFWGPASGIESSRWIAGAARLVAERHRPTLSLIYLPHLDYGLQKLGPGHPGMDAELRAVDALVGDLLDFFAERGTRCLVLSEYGIEPVQEAVFVNRELRRAGWLRVRSERGRELLDPGGSLAFGVADHQVAHVYVADPARVAEVGARLAELAGVERVLAGGARAAAGLDHARAGDLVLVARRGAWFAYDHWLDDRRAPDFARTVDIHRKPGYDPRELFLAGSPGPARLRLAWKLLLRALGFRALLDVIPLDASLVRGSHGRVEQPAGLMPVLMGTHVAAQEPEELPCTAVHRIILDHLFSGSG